MLRHTLTPKVIQMVTLVLPCTDIFIYKKCILSYEITSFSHASFNLDLRIGLVTENNFRTPISIKQISFIITFQTHPNKDDPNYLLRKTGMTTSSPIQDDDFNH